MKRKIAASLIGVGGVVGAAVPVLANEPSGTANQAVVSSMTSVAGDMTATALAILPVALSVVGLLLVVRYGLRTFKVASK